VVWRAGPGERTPELKELATRLVQAAGSWATVDGGTVPAARARLAAAGLPPDLAGRLAPLLDADAPSASVTVTYPQLGGLTPSAASVMVVLRQELRGDGPARTRGRTADVRLARASGGWVVRDVQVAPPPAPATPAPAGAAVLAEPGLRRLPELARADLAAGRVHPRLATLLATLARRHKLEVSVLVGGHPREVFGTPRVSTHTLGLAVDVWAVDGRPVADPAGHHAVVAVMQEAAALGAARVGGPLDPDGPGRTFFANELHHDHLHVSLTSSLAGKTAVRG